MKRQAGFTIIEIMVALTLSMLLIAGVTQIFSGNRETYRTQSGLSTLQENGRFSVDVLRRDLSMAGYGTNRSAKKAPTFAAGTVDGGGTNSDTIAINFQTKADCTGGAITEQVFTRTYDVSLDPDTQVSSLRCNTIPILDGVENMQLLYGLSTESDPNPTPNRYVNASMVPAWDRQVVAIRFALLINSLEPTSREPDTAKFALLDSPELPEANDMLRRRVYTGTVALRNR